MEALGSPRGWEEWKWVSPKEVILIHYKIVMALPKAAFATEFTLVAGGPFGKSRGPNGVEEVEGRGVWIMKGGSHACLGRLACRHHQSLSYPFHVLNSPLLLFALYSRIVPFFLSCPTTTFSIAVRFFTPLLTPPLSTSFLLYCYPLFSAQGSERGSPRGRTSLSLGTVANLF